MSHALQRAGWGVGRDRVARLMRLACLAGVVRRRKPFTTFPAKMPEYRPDWTTAISRLRAASAVGCGYHVCSHPSGFCYTAFVTDAFSRKIVGWSGQTTMRTDALPLEALDYQTRGKSRPAII